MSFAGLAWLLAGPGCSNAPNHDADVPDLSSGGDVTTGGTGGAGGDAGSSGSGGNQVPTDPCDYVLLEGPPASCPKCSPYSPKWDPTCTEPGLVCVYLETPQGGLGAGCTCQHSGGNDAADGGETFRFSCGL